MVLSNKEVYFMKKLTAIFALALVVCMLAGCAGTTVVYQTNCTCPVDSHVQEVPATLPDNTEPAPSQPAGTTAPEISEGAVMTGMAIIATAQGSTSASADADGAIKYDVTIAAVNVDENGVIVDCIIDSVAPTVKFGADGTILDMPEEVLTKTELGEAYGMKAAGFQYEWYEQAEALAQYAIGKTVEQLRAGAVNESGLAADADLAATASIRLGGYVDAIEKAVANARHLGAQAGDELKLAVISAMAADASQDAGGSAELTVDVAAVTMAGDTITACYIDSLQAEVTFDSEGQITSDLAAGYQTKNEKGEAYGMKAWGNATYEWNEQAASFAAYATGKTVEEISGIAIDEDTRPTDADLAASVTIKIGTFLDLIAKAAQ